MMGGREGGQEKKMPLNLKHSGHREEKTQKKNK
jgi:hypothetical protein